MQTRWLIFVLLTPILFVLGFRLYATTHSSDIEPADVTDLLLVRPDIPATNNAYQIFASATNFLNLPEKYDLSDYLWGASNDVVVSHADLASLLESNKVLIAAISDGCRKDYCFRTPPLQLPTLAHAFTQMHLVLLAKVKNQLDCGNMNEALNTALLSLRFGHLVHKDAEYLVEALAGLSMIGRSLTYVEIITDQQQLPSNRVTELILTLSQLEDLRKGFENSYKSEFSFATNDMREQLNTLQDHLATRFLRTIEGEGYMFKPNATKKILAEHWRWQIEKLNYPDSVQLQHDALEYRVPKGTIQRTLFLLGENAVGKIFLAFTTASDFSGILNELHSTETKVSALKTKLLLNQKNDWF